MTNRGFFISIVLAGTLCVTGCADKPPIIQDFCAKLGRRVTDEERIKGALHFYFKDSLKRPREIMTRDNIKYHSRVNELDHFQIFSVDQIKKSPNYTASEIIDDYYKLYPSCCRIEKPSYRNPYSSEFDDEDILHFRWVKDVWISYDDGNILDKGKKPVTDISNKFSYNVVDFGSSDCAVAFRSKP